MESNFKDHPLYNPGKKIDSNASWKLASCDQSVRIEDDDSHVNKSSSSDSDNNEQDEIP